MMGGKSRKPWKQFRETAITVVFKDTRHQIVINRNWQKECE